MKKISLLLFLVSIFTISSISFAHLNVNFNILEKDLYPENYCTLNIILQNLAREEIRFVKLFFEAENSIKIEPEELEIEKIPQNSQVSYSFLIKIGKEAKTSTIRLYTTYYVGSERKSILTNIPLKVVSFPILIVKNVETIPKNLESGRNATIIFEVFNYGYSSAKDVRIKLLSNPYFSFQNDEIYISEIKIGEKAKVSSNLFIHPSLDSSYYTIQTIFQFFNEDRSRIFNETKSFSIKILNEPKIDIIIDSVAGETANLKVINRGVSKIKNILISTSERKYFIEELSPGEYDTFEIILKKDSIEINLTFSDSLNNEYQETKTLKVENLYRENLEKQLLRVNEKRRNDQRTFINSLFFILVLIIVSIILVFVFIFRNKVFSKDKRK